VLRVFLRHDRELFADIGRLLFDVLTRYFTQAAGRSIHTAMVSSHPTFGEFAAWHPHWHAIVLEGGFGHHDRFLFIPLGANEALTEIWRLRVVALFFSKGLLNPDFARKLLSWRHSGLSIDSGTRIYDQEARQALSQYIVRPALSLQKIYWDPDQDAVTWKSFTSGYFRGREQHFSALDFIAQLTLHIPRAAVTQSVTGAPPSAGSRLRSKRREARGRHLVRRYGLCSSLGLSPFAPQTARGQRTGDLERPPRTLHSRAQALVWPTGRSAFRAHGCLEGSASQHALQQESMGTAACQGVQTGRHGLSEVQHRLRMVMMFSRPP
jgi:hypothetical protein